MRQPLVLVTGFGAFEDVVENPSLGIARGLEADPPPGLRVRAGELPVSFDQAPLSFDRLVLACSPETPSALLALGVQKEPTFRLERFARNTLRTGRADNDGATAENLVLAGPQTLGARADVEDLARALALAGAPAVEISEDAGGFVCERVFYHLLLSAERLGVRGAFLHVPRVGFMATNAQIPFVRSMLHRLVEPVRRGEVRGGR